MAPVVGIEEVIALHAALARIFAQNMSRVVRYGLINGLPGFVTVEGDRTLQTTAIEIVDGKIAVVYIVRIPTNFVISTSGQSTDRLAVLSVSADGFLRP